MSLNDLRDELRTQAGSVEPPPAAGRIAAVHALTRRRRRRKVTAVAAATVAVIVGVGALMIPGGDAVDDDEPMPPAADPIRFPDIVGGGQLIAEEIGEPGDTKIGLAIPEVDDVSHLAYQVVCRTPSATTGKTGGNLDALTGANLTIVEGDEDATIGASIIPDHQCRPSTESLNGLDPIKGARSSALRLRIVGDWPTEQRRGVELAVAIYDMNPEPEDGSSSSADPSPDGGGAPQADPNQAQAQEQNQGDTQDDALLHDVRRSRAEAADLKEDAWSSVDVAEVLARRGIKLRNQADRQDEASDLLRRARKLLVQAETSLQDGAHRLAEARDLLRKVKQRKQDAATLSHMLDQERQELAYVRGRSEDLRDEIEMDNVRSGLHHRTSGPDA